MLRLHPDLIHVPLPQRARGFVGQPARERSASEHRVRRSYCWGNCRTGHVAVRDFVESQVGIRDRGRRRETGPFEVGGPQGGALSTGHRYNLTISLSMRNLLNHNYPGRIVGNIES